MTVDRPTKFPARAHASKLVSELVKLMPEAERNGNHAIFVQGHPTSCRDDTDRELPFHQEANFNFLTGAYDVHTASVLVTFNGSDIQHTLFVPPADPLETMWSIPPPTLEDAAVRFDAGAIRSTTELEAQLAQLGDATIHTLPVTHEFPPLPSSVLDAFKKQKHSTEHLRRAFHLTRLTKTAEELELMRKANGITSGAHEVLMRELGRYAAKRAKATVTATKERTGFEGMTQWEVESEQDAEALFVATCRRMGAEMAYLPIVASGSHASTLHYVCNDRLFPSTASPRAPGDTSFTPRRLARGCCGDVPEHDHATSTKSLHTSAFEPQVLLIDAGCEVEGYASDVTRTIPVGNGGKFTPKAAHIYDIVLRMMKEAEERTRVGVHWDDIHLHTHKGHSIGLDVHDSLQYLREVKLDVPASSAAVPAKLFTYLRIRQPLQAGMVLTIEPGCYFPPQLLDMHGVWESPLVDHEVLKTYLPVGGVRLEDSVVVRDNGEPCENITPVGRERAWVEARASGLE
ncbi:hypothetical protein CcaverHIS002_0100320 [Cutaneotrichosporon cavernicola]|nr:hypothetical protein CcaverHIS002_0100320 [Cutaneotrichosporon cavernicola]